MAPPDDAAIETLARAAGLDRAWTDFREEVIAAARQVATQRLALEGMTPADDPWPSMRVPAPAREGSR